MEALVFHQTQSAPKASYMVYGLLGFLFAESNTNSVSLFILLLTNVLIYYLTSLCKHMFYFQVRVEQSVPFHHLSSFSSYYGARL